MMERANQERDLSRSTSDAGDLRTGICGKEFECEDIIRSKAIFNEDLLD
jgi:hypothetical protein